MSEEITFGNTIRKLRLPGIVLTETLHLAGMDLPRHEHANANVNFVLRGAFGERVEHRVFDCRAGSVLVKPDGASHSNRYGANPSHCLIVEWSPDFAGDPGDCPDVLDDVWYTEEPAIASIGWQLYREVREPDSATPLAVRELLADLRGKGSTVRVHEKESGSQPPWLRRIRERLDGAEAPPDFEEIASEADVHPRHLMRAFRRYAGCSIGEYVRRRHVREAQRLLAGTEMPLVAVGVESGFYDQSHFTRTFRRVTGLTPGEYRRLSGSTGPGGVA